jgi:cytoskeletal protein CcmA (bactofilin family)
LKDGSKTISARATRFLPVDMKDRLKSAFNRNYSTSTPENAPDADALDYRAIFNANRSAASQKNPHGAGSIVDGPANQTLLAEPPSSADAGNPARQIAPDIEEMEIVVERNHEAAASPVLEAVLHKTPNPEQTGSAVKAEQLMPVLKQAAKSPSKQDSSPQPELEAKYGNSENGEAVAQKSKSRFFGDFASTESVRLKIEKRSEKRPEAVLMSSNGMQRAQADSGPALVTILGAERGAVPVFALDAETLEQPTNGYHATIEGVAAAPAASEQAHINLLEEYDSMDAKGHESGNGAMAAIDGNSGAAAIAIERNSKFSGQLKFSGAVTIDGQVEGSLVAERIVVHEGGVVNATVEGNTVVIAGTVKGDVCAHSELEILPSGIVDGSVTAPAITVHRGGRVEGLCAIGVPSSS